MNTSKSLVFSSRLRRLGKPGLAEAACASLALLCLLAPAWWMLQKGRAERLAELDSFLRGAAQSSAQIVVSRAALEAAELRVVSVETGTTEAARSVLDDNGPSARSQFESAANRSLRELASGAAKDCAPNPGHVAIAELEERLCADSCW